VAESDLGIIGLGVMGRNLALNAADRGLSVVVYNRTPERTQEFVDRVSTERIEAVFTLTGFIAALREPRKILLMVKAGAPTDEVLSDLFSLVSEGDVLIDGGNAHFEDTERREAVASEQGILYLGAGISGGELGARHGPSIMVGGTAKAYRVAGPLLESLAAEGPEGRCCARLGPSSAGHYVKMVHNGIEYALMQALAETYDLMKRGLGMRPLEMADVFATWGRSELASYLVEITERILRRTDPATKQPLVERIQDKAEQKGTGRWSVASSLDLGSPSTAAATALFARALSALKPERVAAGSALVGPDPAVPGPRDDALRDLRSALLLATVVAYAQGFRQLRDASKDRGYELGLAEVARVWTAGCIIRSALLPPASAAFRAEPNLPLLLVAEPFRTMWATHHDGLRRTVARAHTAGLPVPSFDSALDFADAYRSARLPANLIQAQRDAFGAHGYERVDEAGETHTDWLGA